jgi:transposase
MPAPTSNDIRQSVVRMLMLGLHTDLIMAVSDLSERTVRDIKKRWVETGSADAPERVVLGRPRLLDVGDLWVRKHMFLCPE